ncbi:16S rRNA (cytidine(1402)-2'-O)-methyltransferase [Vitreoscilla massiliensis]|uniref:Ribosomal RNA small subunit methyltransferase I n=1 Tax=Vitreoscilla massiliensis TaxID=1689272 RepID=A0ABY4E589_9NEIS|nr:16S rRNA (cytidine(1402)-2'-O)-methyltransferase [Vitreoscilla massiliensis]UOO90925.1 16S rRNA (cytidine(1402)-2'-O)-methyltransferase [Vitreoscilla massiliensis]
MLQPLIERAQERLEPQTLYVVATPIGNLSDITLHALAVLSKADLVCAEDTRVTGQLLAAYGIKAKLISVREQNEQAMTVKIIEALAAGQIVAQVSDAGSPAVCDPGSRLVAGVRAAGYKVSPVVGASAVIAALSVAGITAPDFYFAGFIPSKPSERRSVLTTWQNIAQTIVSYETPHRIEATLADMQALFPERVVMLAREITKTFETFLIGTPSELQAALAQDSNQSRGEMVLIVHPLENSHEDAIAPEAEQLLNLLLDDMPLKKACDIVHRTFSANKKQLYDLGLTLKSK